MYFRKSRTGHRIDWNPSDQEAAEQAMEETPGVPDVELPEQAPIELPRETARAVREKYREIIEGEE